MRGGTVWICWHGVGMHRHDYVLGERSAGRRENSRLGTHGWEDERKQSRIRKGTAPHTDDCHR